ncbi:replication factor A-related protein, putative [Babesia ovis]|uniref:Replication factor A-related protein, putative n=1 Tax=Babesia ovis TaxID=5869 RepID=A0A9W5T9C1_BABOV|nr:replication factor A-related protein, putative [Babesia ovis]
MEEYFPIKNLTTYTTNWTIKARVLDKSPLRTIKGDNHIMHVDVVDKHGDSIRIKFWGKSATKWYEVLQKGNVYTFSKGNVELSNKRFNTTPHNYEITCHQDSIIEAVEDDVDIKMQRDHKLLTLRDIKSMPQVTQAPVDLLCILNAVQPVTNIVTKTGRELSKRTVSIVDDTGYEMDFVLWGEHAKMDEIEQMEGKAILATRVGIREWQGTRNCQSTGSSEIKLATQENIKEPAKLTQLETWFESAKANNETFKSVKQQTQNTRDSYELVDVATLLTKTKGSFVIKAKLRKLFWKNKEGAVRMWYQACPMCSKKVIMDEDTNRYRCIACDDASVVPIPRYVFQCNFMDSTGKLNAHITAEIGDKLLGKTAKELEDMDAGTLKQFCDLDATHKEYKISGYIKANMYNGETRYQFNVTRLDDVNYPAETAYMLEKMQITYDDVLQFLGIATEDRGAKKAKVNAEPRS